jgi:hypothetical protein
LGRRDLFRLAYATFAIITGNLGLTGLGGWNHVIPEVGIIVLAGLTTGLAWMAFRLGIAELHEFRQGIHQGRQDRPQHAENVIIVGAGQTNALRL